MLDNQWFPKTLSSRAPKGTPENAYPSVFKEEAFRRKMLTEAMDEGDQFEKMSYLKNEKGKLYNSSTGKADSGPPMGNNLPFSVLTSRRYKYAILQLYTKWLIITKKCLV